LSQRLPDEGKGIMFLVVEVAGQVVDERLDDAREIV
jgi:hypothetical protein